MLLETGLEGVMGEAEELVDDDGGVWMKDGRKLCDTVVAGVARHGH